MVVVLIEFDWELNFEKASWTVKLGDEPWQAAINSPAVSGVPVVEPETLTAPLGVVVVLLLLVREPAGLVSPNCFS